MTTATRNSPAALRGRLAALRVKQDEVAARSGLTRQWVNEVLCERSRSESACDAIGAALNAIERERAETAEVQA